MRQGSAWKRAERAVNQRLPELLIGLRWLFDTEQPDGAMVSAGGQMLRSGWRTLRFRPVDWQGYAVVEIIGAAAAGDPTPRAELEAYALALDDMGEDVVSSWIGRRGQVRTIALARPVHPTLKAAVDRYLAGCPEHEGHHCAHVRRGRNCSVSLRTVQRAAGRHRLEFDALAGPWPNAFDPSGELRRIAAGVAPGLGAHPDVGSAV